MLEGQHYQNAYVTRDVDKAVEVVEARADVRQIIRFEVTTAVTTPPGPVAQNVKLAFLWIGDLQIELIQPISGSIEIYREALTQDDTLAFHHICMRVKNWDEFRKRIDAQSFPVVVEGGSDVLKFLYLDARPLLGHYLEYIWMTDEMWAQLGGR